MKQRIKLADRQLPNYSKGEEIFNMVYHIVGAALGIAALVLCIIVSAKHHSGIGVVSSCIYGVTSCNKKVNGAVVKNLHNLLTHSRS